MEEVKHPIETITLVQKLGTYNYKLVIPVEVERKIRFTCQKVWNTEWSGTLFFTHEGSFENNDLVIRCVDIYIMDIGTQAYTEFDMNPDVIAYMCDNPELLDCQMGLIHSHNNMSTFFSGTDTATLKEEGRDRNNFVSLIVNNAGTYTAAITRRIKSKRVTESTSYEFFGDGIKFDTKEYTSEEANEIEWYYLKIEKEGVDYSFPEMAARLEEIRQTKAEKAKKTQTPIYQNGYKPIIANSYGTKAAPANLVKKEVVERDFGQRTLFGDVDYLPFEEEYEIPYDKVSFDKATIKSLVLQLISGSILVSTNGKIDVTKFAKLMPSLYERRFGKGKDGMDNFNMWAEIYVEYLTWYVSDVKLEKLGFDETEICAICAHDIIEELTKLPENKYIKGYINALQKYLKI